MLHRIGFWCLVAVLLLQTVAEATNYDSYTGFKISGKAVLPTKEKPVSLWFSKEDIPSLREKKIKDSYAEQLWKKVSTSKYILAKIPKVISKNADKRTAHMYYGDMSQIAMYNAFMYQMKNGGEAEKYKKVAIAAMLRAFDGPFFKYDPMDKGCPTDEIYQAVWMQNYAAAYDWIRDALSEEENKQIRQRLVKEAEYVSTNLFRWGGRTHNHLSKPAWGLGSLALALCEEKDAAVWLERALKASNMNTSYFFSGDGIYREGSHYFLFSALNFIPFLYHYRNVSGVDNFAEFQPVFEAVLITRNANGWLPNIEDSFIRPFPTHLVVQSYMEKETKLHKTAPLGELLQWNFRNTNFAPFAAIEKKSGYNYTGATWDFPLPLIEYITYQPRVKAVEPELSKTYFMEGGQTVFRNNYNTPNTQKYLLFHGVAEADNHNHEDTLSFIMFANDQMMASDGGYTRDSYGNKLRKSWYLKAEAHNVVTCDGYNPIDFEENQTPPSRLKATTSFFDFEEKSASYAGKRATLKRAIAFPDHEYFIVVDRIEAEKTSEIKSFFHGGRAKLDENAGTWTWNYDNDVYGTATQLKSRFIGKGWEITQKQGELTYIKGDYKAFPYLQAKKTGKTLALLNILIPTDKKVSVSDKSTDKIYSAEIRYGSSIHTVMTQTGVKQFENDGIKSNANFMWTDIKNKRCMLRDATEIMVDGKATMKSEKPFSLLVAYSDKVFVKVLETNAEVTVKSDLPITSATARKLAHVKETNEYKFEESDSMFSIGK